MNGGIMKIALTLAASLLAFSSLAYAADNSSGTQPDGGTARDDTTTGSINRPDTGRLDDATNCREGVSDGAPCQEDGTTKDM
jgi:hypothetical protein